MIHFPREKLFFQKSWKVCAGCPFEIVLWVKSMRNPNGDIMKTLHSITTKLVHTAAHVCIIPLLPAIGLMWLISRTCELAEATEMNERSDSPNIVLSPVA